MIIRRGHISLLLSLMMILFLILLIVEAMTLREYQRINADIKLLEQGRYIEPEQVDLSQAEIQFAYAYHLHMHQMFEQAVDAYGRAQRMAPKTEVKNIYYNLGNLYLEQAIILAEQLGIDRATALADVSKELYQSALKDDPHFWDAKYNLEAAQRLSRDLPLANLDESPDVLESSTELWSAMPGFPLGLP